MNTGLREDASTRVFHRDIVHQPPLVSHASGVHVWDAGGREYLDASSGSNVVVSLSLIHI